MSAFGHKLRLPYRGSNLELDGMDRDKGTTASINGEKCCVIWFGHPDARERMALAAEGWQVRAIAGHGPEQIRIRGTDREVLLFDLRQASPLEIRWMAHHASSHPFSDALVLGTPTPDAQDDAAMLLSTCKQHIEHNDLKTLGSVAICVGTPCVRRWCPAA